jgi:fructokinase
VRIGVDLGGTKIEAVVLADDGTIVVRRRVATPRDDYAATVDTVGHLVEAVEGETGRCSPVGIGMPGTISPATGRVKNANSTWLNGRPLREDLESRLGRPVRLANDANCFALSEARDGAGAGARVVFGVILGTGVGGGIVVDGRLLTGPNAVAGEWGHNPLPWPTAAEWPGPPCYCGRTGCVELFLSGPGLSREHEQRTGEVREAAEIGLAAAQGEEASLASLETYAHRLARGLAMVVNVLDPDVIVLGGGLSNLAALYARLPALWGEFVFSDRVDTRLAPPRHGDSSGVRGAAWLWEAGSDVEVAPAGRTAS